ncbi:hypothetical protein [Desulfobacca acetoxidans]
MNNQIPKIIHLRCYGYPTRRGTWIASCIDLSLIAERSSAQESIDALHEQILLYVESVFDTKDKNSIPYLLSRPVPWYQKLHYYLIGTICRFAKIRRGFKFKREYLLPQAA